MQAVSISATCYFITFLPTACRGDELAQYLPGWMNKKLFNHRYGASWFIEEDRTMQTCKWWQDVYGWSIPTDGAQIQSCLYDTCCNVESNCMQVHRMACHRPSNAHYVTITTLPLAWFLLYTPNHEYTKEENLDINKFSPQVCAGRSCNAYTDWGDAATSSISPDRDASRIVWPALPSDFASRLPSTDKIYSRTCLEIYSPDTSINFFWKIAPCLNRDSIDKLMFSHNTDTACSTMCEYDNELHNCVGNEKTYFNKLGFQLEQNRCTKSINAACLQNKNSVSMPICQLVGGRRDSQWGQPKCISVDFMYNVGLGSIFGERMGNTWTADNELIGFKIPSDLAEFPGIVMSSILGFQSIPGNIEQCTETIGAKHAETAVLGTYDTFSDLNLANAPISLQDRSLVLKFLRDDFTCGPCPDKQGTDNFAYNFHAPSGLARCRPCAEHAELRVDLSLPCGNRVYSKCQICPQHHRVSNSKVTDTSDACALCPDSAPYRPNPKSANEVDNLAQWKQCGRCPDLPTLHDWTISAPRPQMFNRQLLPTPCIRVPHLRLDFVNNKIQITLDAGGVSSPDAEYYQMPSTAGTDRSFTSTAFQQVPKGYYLVYAPNTIQHMSHLPCDGDNTVCEPFQFRALCGHLFGGNDMYVRWGSNAVSVLASQVDTSVNTLTPTSNYRIVREGKCTDCLSNEIGYYNDECSSATNSAGTSKQCKSVATHTCEANEYLEHTDIAGCNQTNARSDYVCKPCPVTWITRQEQSQYRIFIVVGCGMAATELERWDKQTVQVIDNVTRPGTVNCLYSASAPDINKCTHKGRYTLHEGIIY